MNGTLRQKILKQAIAYNPSSKRCHLCLWDKCFKIYKPLIASLNKRNELYCIFV